ncbi:hypothetical protein [Escherichia coli]|uniref:hypothetical protein n=1 Tax=Escherichia coli TaxID=562 RepID=UPI00162E06F1|nr:hypothetical protein [Escherichia coli]
MTLIGGIAGSVTGSLQIPVNLGEKIIHDLANIAVSHYAKVQGVEVSLVGVIDATVQDGPNGKIYSLKLKLKIVAGTAHLYKIFLFELLVPSLGIPYVVSIKYLEDVGI